MDDIIDFSPSTSAADRRLRPSTLALMGFVVALTVGGYQLLTAAVAPRPVAAPAPAPAIRATAAPPALAIRPALTISPGAPAAALAAIPTRHATVATGTTEVIGGATGPIGIAAIAGPGWHVVELLCLGHGLVSVTLGDAGIFLDESIHSPPAPTTRLSCADPSTPISAEVEITGTSLAMKLDPDPATVGGIAWRVSHA